MILVLLCTIVQAEIPFLSCLFIPKWIPQLALFSFKKYNEERGWCLLTSEIHQHLSTGSLHKVHSQKGFCLIPIMEWKMIFCPNIMPILVYNKASCKYFWGAGDLMPILQMRKLKHQEMVREWGMKTFTEFGIKFRIWLLAQDSNHVRALTLWNQQKSNFKTFFWHY